MRDPLRTAYHNQKGCAKERGIEFNLSFEQWLCIWRESGHLDERGRHQGDYVMARYGDIGAYEEGNVKIITTEDNIREHMCGRSKLLGRKVSEQHRRNIIKALTGRPCSAETRAKIGEKARVRAAAKRAAA